MSKEKEAEIEVTKKFMDELKNWSDKEGHDFDEVKKIFKEKYIKHIEGLRRAFKNKQDQENNK